MRVGDKGIGGILRQIRVNFGLTHHAAAGMCGVDQGQYSRVESADSQSSSVRVCNKMLMGFGYELHILPIGTKTTEKDHPGEGVTTTQVTIGDQLYRVTFTPINDRKD